MKKSITLISITSIIVMLGSLNAFSQWSPPVNISPNANNAQLNENMGRCLDVSGDTLHVVWSQQTISGRAVYYSHSLDTGLTWSVAVPISDTIGNCYYPAIAVSGSTVHVVWFDNTLSTPASWYRRSLDGGNTWGQRVLIDSNTIFWPGVAASGSLVAMSLNKGIFDSTLVFMRRSIDNGTNWDPEVQVSHRPPVAGRSEDPAIAVLGSDIHLSWNDNRIDTMQIWYSHSPDGGITWNGETRISGSHSYTTMVCPDGPNVDVPYGNYGGGFNVWLRQSADTGSIWGANQQLTSIGGRLYPFEVRNGLNLHIVCDGNGIKYLHSGDGGLTWDSEVALGTGGAPFIAYTGCMLHVIRADSGKIKYIRNPTGNCVTTGVNVIDNASEELKLFPNPTSNYFIIKSSSELGLIIINNIIGELIYQQTSATKEQQIDLNKEPAGVYILSVQGKHFRILKE